MRIAYISLHWPRTRSNSVGRKIQRQIKAWQDAGHEARVFMHTSRYEPEEELLAGEIFTYEGPGKLRTELSRMDAAGRLIGALRSFAPDLIYLRYGIYVHPLYRLFGIAPVVEDVTTNDLIQHQEWGWLYTLYNRMTRGVILRRVEGLVAISHELASSPIFTIYRKPTIVIANGIDLESYEPLPAPANETPRLVFMGSPTAGFVAHGIDKLVELAGLCPDIHLDIIGYDGVSAAQAIPSNITFHGYLPMERYKVLLANADAAISTLSFHRIGLEEASPLKSREYLAYGLPMVVPYKDTDLDDLDCDFLLKIPNREDNIRTHWSAIRDFAYRMRGKRVDRKLIMKIDYVHKEAERLKFFEEIVKGSR